MARVVWGEWRFKARRRKRRVLWASAVCAALLFVVLCSIFLARASFLRITNVMVSGTSVTPPSVIQALTQQNITGNYLFFYPKNNILLYPKNAIRQELSTQFPTFKSVDIYVGPPDGGFHKLAIVVVERQPTALWCADASSSTCFLLDADGLAYAAAPSYSGDAYKKYSGIATSGTLPWQYLTPQEFHSLSALVDAIAKKESADTVATISVDANNDVHVVFVSGFELMFALHDDTGKLFERFGLALAAAPFMAHPLADFEYLDLRFGDKLYYKLK